MKHVDFTKKRLELHKDIEQAIKNLMREKKVSVVDLASHLEKFDGVWIVRRTLNGIEEVMLAAIKLDVNKLFYMDVDTYYADGEWLPFDGNENIVAGSIDSVYEGVYQRLNIA